jgi:hypothetical protein
MRIENPQQGEPFMMKCQHAVMIALGGLLTVMITVTAQAALNVDLNDNDAVVSPPGGAPPSPTQADFVSVTQTGATGIVTDIGTIDVGLSVVVGSSFDDRDRGTVGGAGAGLSDLLRDFIFTASTVASGNKPTMDITLSGLDAGHYVFNGYLHDRNVEQGYADISVSNNAGSSFKLGANDITMTTGASPASVGRGGFSFYADGTTDVVIRAAYDGGGSGSATNRNIVVSGFTVAPREGLFVDFNDNDNEQSGNDAGISFTQAGYVSVTQAGASGIDSQVGTVDVSFNTLLGNPDRDRGALTSSVVESDLLRDFLFNQSSSLDITVSGLDAGIYEFTGYFHDKTVDQGFADILFSTDGGSSFVNGVLGVDYSVGSSPDPFGMGRFTLVADGVNDVVFRIIGSGPNNLINGFDLVAIPTPTALGAGLGMLGVMSLRRR